MKWNLDFIDDRSAGIDLFINPDGTCILNFCVLKKTGDKITSEKSGNELSDFAEIFSALDKKIPILLSVNGKGIIHKKINKTSDDNFESLLSKVLPNSKIEDFYIQIYEPGDATCFISIIRKNLIDPVIKSFTDAHSKLTRLILGPFSIQAILPILSSVEEPDFELKFSNYDLLITQGAITNYTLSQNHTGIHLIQQNGFELQSNELISYATAFSFFNVVDSINSNIASVNEAYVEFKNETKFKKTGIAILMAIFTILLINFIAAGYLSDQVRVKAIRFARGSKDLNQVDSLKRQIEERTNFLSKSGLSEPSRTSFFADEIASDLPAAIILSSINIQPLIKDENDTKKIQFENKKIQVGGKSKYALDVNEWMKLLKRKDWVKSISLINYRQKEGNEPGEFIIEIGLK